MKTGSIVELLRDFPRLDLKTGDKCRVVKELGPKMWEIMAVAPPWEHVAVYEEWAKDVPEAPAKS